MRTLLRVSDAAASETVSASLLKGMDGGLQGLLCDLRALTLDIQKLQSFQNSKQSRARGNVLWKRITSPVSEVRFTNNIRASPTEKYEIAAPQPTIQA